MPTFFIPAADTPEQAEKVYESIKRFIVDEVGPVADDRIYSLSFTHDSRPIVARVGEIEPLEREKVFAILRSASTDLYFICTANRGVVRGEPIFVGGGWQTVATPFTDA